ncbi:MAG: 5-formyltetrahydrofolate cyclo-ligase, partial [Acaryochloridaceae cyanobacterium SU_2_1]|nr:5-formyltetrahydrofolate cyclo-ligase [Acaryochloridaceae cyanobacterium SU_2_1]
PQPIWGLPRCVGQDLVWHRWFPVETDRLQPGSYGILEPHPDWPILKARDVDLILVPALACDRQGFRLGYGGGYYDRLLANPAWAAIPTIGLVFASALLTQLPRDPWDRPLQNVCTEVGFFAAAPI